MNKLLLSTAVLFGCASLLRAADELPPVLYFQKVEPKALTTLSIVIEGDQVAGNQHWIPKEMDGAHGMIQGTIKGNIVRVIYSYTIEGSEQTEEQLFKIEGDRIIKGEGDMKDPKDDGHMVFRDVSKVTFTGDVLKKVAVLEPKAGTPERKAIMDAMRGPVSKKMGKPVKFIGEVRMKGDWARFGGKVETADGEPPANEDAAAELELDYTAFLHKNEDGVWKPVTWGFAGDISVIEEAKEKCEGASWVLFD